MEVSDKMVFVRKSVLDGYIGGSSTVVVTGASRGGTSAIAYALERAGLNMGEGLGRNYEDTEFMRLMNNRSCNVPRLLEVIEQRNSVNERWGFKLPRAAFHLQWLDTHLRSPIFVFVYRDPLSVARSILRRDAIWGNEVDGLIQSIQHPLRFFEKMTTSIPKLSAPVVLLSYETAHFGANAFVPEFLGALGFTDEEGRFPEIASELSLPGYKEPA